MNEVLFLIFMLLPLGSESPGEGNETHLDKTGQAKFRSALETVSLKKR